MSDPVFDPEHAKYLAEQRHGVLATIAADGSPQAKPVGFRYDPALGTIDISGFEMERSAKFRNVAVNPRVAFTVEDVPDPDAGAAGVRFVEIRGTAEQVQLDTPGNGGVGSWIIRIHPRRLVSYNVASTGFHSANLGGQPPAGTETRPTIGLSDVATDRARWAVQRQVEELQAGLGDGDAQTCNRHFAADVMWGSPYGASVDDYDTLHAIHRRLHANNDRTDSRYEIVRVLCPTPDVALAQVRRQALDDHGEPIKSHDDETRFSEMALYVLVRRNGTWWLTAGQNTVINIDHGAVKQ
jgi:PPOX class F420-dependent enzyme/OxyR family protein